MPVQECVLTDLWIFYNQRNYHLKRCLGFDFAITKTALCWHVVIDILQKNIAVKNLLNLSNNEMVVFYNVKLFYNVELFFYLQTTKFIKQTFFLLNKIMCVHGKEFYCNE